MKLCREQLKVLERIFAAEIFGKPIAQFRSKHLSGLEESGYVLRAEATLPGRFPVIIRGWILTERGRMAYCESCRNNKPKRKAATRGGKG